MQVNSHSTHKESNATVGSHFTSRDVHDPDDREVHSKEEIKEKNLDKTIADSFPASDPPSTIPDPSYEES